MISKRNSPNFLSVPRNTSSETRLVVLYLVPGFSMLEMSSAVEAMSLANQVNGPTKYEWRVVSQEMGSVIAGCGLTVNSDRDLATQRARVPNGRQPNMIMVFGGDRPERSAVRSLEAWLREAYRAGVGICGVRSGTDILASAGLLRDRRCSVHWEHMPSFSETFMDAIPNTRLFQVDDGIWTCAGGSAIFDMTLRFIELDGGHDLVTGICQRALVERARADDERQRLPLSSRLGTVNPVVLKVVQCMEEHLADPLSVADLSSSVSLSRRQVERIFLENVGKSPIQYYRELRLEKAHLLLRSTTLTILEVAVSCGFVASSHFSKAYRDVYGLAPAEARRASRANPAHVESFHGPTMSANRRSGTAMAFAA